MYSPPDKEPLGIMSSMHRKTLSTKPLPSLAICLAALALLPASGAANAGNESAAETAATVAGQPSQSAPVGQAGLQIGSQAAAQAIQTQGLTQGLTQAARYDARYDGQIASAVQRWKYLTETRGLSYSDYASFITSYPGFPRESLLQTRAENALDEEAIAPQTLIAFFDAHPPVTNSGKARYALALSNMRRSEAFDWAREAWRGGEMSDPAEAYILGLFGSRLTADDHAARMDQLLWQRKAEAATRQIANLAPAQRSMAMARLALIQGETPTQAGVPVPSGALSDPGYVYNLARHYRIKRQMPRSINLLATRPQLSRPALDAELMVGEILRAAKAADARNTVAIASKIDDLFAPGEDISAKSFRLRDDYTTLMWAGGTNALWRLGDGRRAAPLFYRYGAAAQTPQTRSKGFYWAGLASKRAGNQSEANRYFELAAAYPARFYGQLALKELGRGMPNLAANVPATMPDPAAIDAFNAQPITQAVRHVAKGAPWRTGIQFYRTLARAADTEQEHVLVANLAREIGRRDLSVNVAEAAGADGLSQFTVQGFPVLPLPQGADFTLTHAITRQESQFAQNAISHAGARGLMQLMPGTAREEARFAGVSYMSASLINDAQYNVRLGSNHIERLVSRYNGSYPLAFAAYNAGPGNVNKWLRANGDPRTGAISWTEWIERIPFFETKNYVARVVENAAVYEHLYPERTPYNRARMAHEFLR
jgi:soluble lytic murein transglycosylase